MSSVSVSVSNMWLQMTDVCCFFMWTPVHYPSITGYLGCNSLSCTAGSILNWLCGLPEEVSCPTFISISSATYEVVRS